MACRASSFLGKSHIRRLLKSSINGFYYRDRRGCLTKDDLGKREYKGEAEVEEEP